MITRWMGRQFTLRDGDRVKVVGVTMPLPGVVNLAFEHSKMYRLEPGVAEYGPLYLTANELANNVAP